MKCPLTGEICNKYRAFRITEIAKGGKTTTFSVCEDCLKSYLSGEKQPTKEIAKDTLQTIQSLVKAVTNLLPVSGNPCPNCKTTLKDVVTKQRLGCMQCWEHFAEPLRCVLEKIQAGPTHTGKRPIKQNREKDLQEYIARQQCRIRKACEEENYEEAGQLKILITAFNALYNRFQLAVAQKDYEQANLIQKEMWRFLDRE